VRKIVAKFSKKIIIISGICLVLAGFAFTRPAEKYFEVARNLDIFASLFKEVNGFYVDEVNPEILVAIGIEAMTHSLDPYTTFIPEEESESFRTLTTGQYAGLGALIGQINGHTYVTMVDEDYPAYKNGIKVGDQILEIDGNAMEGKDQEDISRLLKGEIGESVVLKIKRTGSSRPLDFKIKREKIKIDNVPYYGMVEKEIGYILLSDFTTDAGKEVANAVESLKKIGAKSLILDLRGNPGGLLNEAIDVCNVFIPKGMEVVSTKGKVEQWNRSHQTIDEPIDTQIPIAVLINQGTASAAEIVSGVMQDYERGILIGKKSFGKGLVQATRSLPYNSQLKITTAKYYTPSGRCIQAIDYATRNEDGSVDKIPDSLKVAFKTRNGRTVFDGGGIDPDFITQNNSMAPVAAKLIMDGFIFEYATEYYFSHPSEPVLKSFEITDSEYNNFVNWMQDKDFTYETSVEKKLDQIERSAQDERYFESLEDEINSLRSSIDSEKAKDFISFKSELKKIISTEIISRYFLRKGEIEYSIKEDQDVLEAVSILKDKSKYANALKGKI